MFKFWLTALLGLSLLSGNAAAQMAFVEGKDYQAISPPVETSEPDKVVVTEIFWYGCPHCFRFEPYIEQWSSKLPDGVVFEQVPSALNQPWVVHARAFYAFKMMGVLDQVHRDFFDAIHLERQKLFDLDSIAGWVASKGLDEKAFRDDAASFQVETQIRKNALKEKSYGNRGVPAVIVNGKYLVSATLAGSFERMIQIMNFLASRELEQ
ncbi:MAG TPA: thiol:disulfide interchange protein DsbA/DsbL [Gammaproteobacteria bacterium]|nr:thiol:disulfide interchange protein DsbA/DsbL [Gammaproteobacteria bacterium]